MEPQNKQPDTAESTQRIHYSALKTLQTIRLIHAHRSRADGEKKLHPQRVMINDCTCQVQESVYPILAFMCDEPDVCKDFWFWIDYLCINQENNSERSQQIKFMETLFRKS
ncbi:hypothetical protein LA080_013055 [Diaporthe eres]|nr:hypothetical protein LA080_013055 [Diaporthe eres]